MVTQIRRHSARRLFRVSTVCLYACYTSRHLHCLATELIFFVTNCLSRRPYSDQGVAMEFSWRSFAFLRCSWWRFSAPSRCFHCASTALTAHATRFHGVATLNAMTSPRTPCSLRANATDDHDVCTTTLVCATELLLRCRRPYCAAMVTLRRPYCALLGRRATPSDGVCFEYTQSAHRRSTFYATPPCPMAMPLRCCGDACVRTARISAFCNF